MPRDAIVCGKFKPRKHLVEAELSARFEVSRTPVREAIRNLVGIGMVKLVPYKGAFVADIDANEMRNIYVVRSALEGLATKLATPILSEAEIEELENLMALMQTHVEKGDSLAFGTSNESFHKLIYSRCENPVLIETLNDLFERSAVFRRSSWQSSGERLKRLMVGHRAILDAIKCRDTETAQAEAALHIDRILSRGNQE